MFPDGYHLPELQRSLAIWPEEPAKFRIDSSTNRLGNGQLAIDIANVKMPPHVARKMFEMRLSSGWICQLGLVLALCFYLPPAFASWPPIVDEELEQTLSRLENLTGSMEERANIIRSELEGFLLRGDKTSIFAMRCCLLSTLCHLADEQDFQVQRQLVDKSKSEIDDELALCLYHTCVADTLLLKRKLPQQALLEYHEAVALGDSAGAKRVSAINLSRIAYCYSQLGAIGEAVRVLEQLRLQCKRDGIKDVESTTANNLALYLVNLDRIDEAEAVFRSIPTGDNARVDLYVFTGFAEIALQKSEPAAARQWIDKAIARIGKQIMPREQAILELLRARSYLLDKNYDLAEQHCIKAQDGIDQGFRGDDLNIVLGQIYFNTERENEGIALIKSALESKRFQSRLEALEALSRVYFARKDLQQAHAYVARLNQARLDQLTRESALNVEVMRSRLDNERRLADERLKHELNIAKLQQAADLERLENEKRQINAEAAARSRNATVIWSALIAISTCCCLALLIYLRKSAQQREIQLALAAAKKEAQLNQQLERKRRLESIGMLTSHVAHDFNNLLQVFATSADSLNQQLKQQSPVIRDILWTMDETVEIGSRVTDQMLSFTRGTNPTHRFEMAQLLESSELLFAAATGDEIGVRLEMPDPDLWIEVDRAGFCNAILNMVLNAVDASQPGDTVLIRAARSQPDSKTSSEFVVSTAGKIMDEGTNNFVRVDVIDSGTGMSAHTLANCLDDHFTTKGDGVGCGLGLSSVVRFAEKAGGYVQITSRPGHGTQASIFLPQVDRQPRDAESQQEPPVAPFAGCKVAVVEDNELVLNSLTELLARQGMTPIGFADGQLAIEAFTSDFDFQIVISDIRMPGGVSGFEIADWVKQHQGNIPVVLISGNDQPADASYQFLRKPFTYESLLQVVGQALGQQTLT